MHRWGVGMLGVPAVWWSSRFRCGMDSGDEAVSRGFWEGFLEEVRWKPQKGA